MKIRLLFFYISLFFLCPLIVYSYQNKKVILLVNRSSQHDSFGYNIVSGFSGLVYQLLSENKVKLWDSPLKSYMIDFENLKGIEANHSVEFLKVENLFIYEYWSVKGSSSSFQIVGFTFSSPSSNNKEISLGYVDYNEILPFLSKRNIEVNINGYCQTTFFEVFMNKAFSYDLIYFDDAPVITSTGKKAEKQYLKGVSIKNKAFGDPSRNRNKVTIQPCKTITYEIKNFEYDSGNYLIFKTLENYFNSSKELLRFFAGDEIYALFKNNRLLITTCKITEMLVIENNQLKQYFIRIVPQVFGKDFYALTIENLDTLHLYIGKISLADYILTHNYKYYLTEINGFPVDPADTRNNMEALMSGRFRNFRSEKTKPKE